MGTRLVVGFVQFADTHDRAAGSALSAHAACYVVAAFVVGDENSTEHEHLSSGFVRPASAARLALPFALNALRFR
jgi:hypothetical protein